MAIDTIISEMLSAGLALEDIEHLENLDDPRVFEIPHLAGGPPLPKTQQPRRPCALPGSVGVPSGSRTPP